MKIYHAIPGRLRLKSTISQTRLRELKERLLKQKGILFVEIHPKSSSFIIRYLPSEISQREILNQIKRFLEEKRIILPQRAEEKGFDAKIVHFFGLSLCVGYVLVKKVLLRQVIAQGLLSPLGIITSFSAFSTLKSAVNDWKKQKKMSLELFIGGTALVAVGAGEAITALEILWIEKGADLLTDYLTDCSKREIKKMFSLAGQKTFIVKKGVEVEVSCDDLQVGDVVSVHAGQRLPVDGVIIKGEALIDTASITGRALPEKKKKAEKVFAGSYVRQGVIFVKAERVGKETYLHQILKLAEEALSQRASVEEVADKLAGHLLELGLFTTAGTFLVTANFTRTLSVMLTMACPCATALAAGSAISVGLFRAMQKGILIKGGQYLEEIGNADVFCFDKTGTITLPEPEVGVIKGEEEAVLRLAVSAEQHNKHPIAIAIKKEAKKRGIFPVSHAFCDYILGEGVKAEIEGKQVFVGNENYLRKNDISIPLSPSVEAKKAEAEGQTVVYVALEDKIIGLIGIVNRLQRGIKEVIKCLKKDGVKKCILITGDKPEVVERVMKNLPFDTQFSALLPEDKALVIERLKGNGHKVVMVGDGINDTMALAKADIGIAVSNSTEVALATADIVFKNEALDKLIYLRELSHKTIKIVYENFWLAVSTNLIGAMFGILGILPPVLAGLLHITHTLGIIANSSRLFFFEPYSLVEDEKRVIALPRPEDRVLSVQF